MNRRRWLALLLLAFPLAAATWTGGWAVITIDDLPEHLVTGLPVDLTFTIRQHGMTPIADLRPVVNARSGERDTRVVAMPTGKPGTYSAKLAVPRDGDWKVTIDSDFGDSRVTLLPIRASAAHASNGNGAAAPAAWERGRALFVAKGCLTCHLHREVSGAHVVPVGPDLSDRRFAPDYLARFLDDPSIRPPTSDIRMPDLDLDDAEIRALVAFINGDRQRTDP
ncbi:MAG: cytochrome c [Gemmatimonadetes bacterium]|nr:cytochrome c [Gemmatimonadota bacterium]